MSVTTSVELSPRPVDAPTAKVTLIRPPVTVFPTSLSILGPVPPLGVAYVAASLLEVGHKVQVIDAAGEAIGQLHDFETPVGVLRRVGLSPEEVVERIDADVQIIGIGQMFLHEWPHAREIAELARERFPDVLIIGGGENATAFHKWMFEETDAFDAVVLGEGERTTIELADRVAQGASLAGMASIVLRDKDGKLTEGTLPKRVRDLESIPRPAWDLFPLQNYWDAGDFFGVERGRSMPMLATRGCPYKCSFCSAPQMWTTRYNVRDPKDLVDEIQDYVERWGVKSIHFCDLTPITKRKWTLQFCDELEARNLDLTWQLPIGTRSEVLDEEVLQRLWDTGCRNITYAPESGSPRMLELWGKKLDLDHLMMSLRAAKKVGLTTHINTIIGHPKETWKDRMLTWRLFVKAAQAGCDTGSPIMFCPYPGSADFMELIDSGKLVADEPFLYVGLARGSASAESFNPGISARGLRLVQLGMLLTFYGIGSLLHPSRLLHYVRTQFNPELENNHLEALIRIKRKSILRVKKKNLTGRQRPQARPDTDAPKRQAA